VRTAISVSAGSLPFTELAAYVRAAEDIGVDCCWVQEEADADAVSALAALAVSTRRIKLGAGVLPMGSRTPALVTLTARSLARLARGRFVLGLGAGSPETWKRPDGAPVTPPVTRLSETIDAVRRGLSGIHVPVYIGASSPRTLRLTGEVADGWLASTSAPYAPGLAAVRDAATAAGRDLADLDCCVPLTADADTASALEAAKVAGATSVRLVPTGATTAERIASLERAQALCE
jgi:alkanesulfonate monooxygenase SsuD/methylene tetrahydromethanopterin reductase-like flavin-dependent oxidoreductase (luciferase family)